MPEIPEVTTEVVELVKKSINELGATSKENYEELNRKYKEMHTILEKQGDTDPLTKEQLDKYSADVTVRQDEVDKAVAAANERMDEMETAMRRIRPSATMAEDRKQVEEYIAFRAALAAGQQKTMRWNQRMELREKPDFEMQVNYERAFNEYLHVDEIALSPESYKALQVGVDVDGGYIVTPFMSNRVAERLFESDPIRQLASIESIGTDAFEMMEDIDEAGAEWESETVATTNAETPKMKKKRIPVHIMGTRPRITQMLVDDSNINIEAWLANKVSDKFARTEAAAFVTGDGVGKPRGFGTYSAWTTNGTYEHGKIEQQNMGHATEFTTDGLINVKYRLIEQYLNRGTWLTNRLNVRDIMKLKDGDGQYIWRPGMVDSQPAMLLGLPFRMSTTVATTAAAALAIYLADWKEAYLIVDRQGINIQRDPYTAKPFIEYYTRKRVGADVINYQAIKIGKVAA